MKQTLFKHPPEFLLADSSEQSAAALLEYIRSWADFGQEQTWLLPGGSSPVPFFKALAGSGLDLSRLTFFLTDERIVPKTHDASNYRLLTDHFYAGIDNEEHRPDICVFYDPELDRATNDRMLREQLDRLPPVTFALMGIGTDAHTASLFPHKAQNFKPGDWLYAHYHSGDRLERVSLSFDFLNAAERMAFLCTGEAKRDILQTVCTLPYDPESYPVQYFFRHFDRPLVLAGDEAAWGAARRALMPETQ